MLNTQLLDLPRASLAAARERLALATAALERGRAAYSAASDRIRDLDDEDARYTSLYAERLQRAAVDGVPAVPYLENAPDAAERHRAQVETRCSAEALERLTAAHKAAQADLAAAEQALRAAIDQALDARSCELMETVDAHLRALERVGAELAELLPDTRFENASGLPSEPAVRELLKHLPARPRSDLDVPINELRLGAASVSRLSEMRARLMNDAAEQREDVAA